MTSARNYKAMKKAGGGPSPHKDASHEPDLKKSRPPRSLRHIKKNGKTHLRRRGRGGIDSVKKVSLGREEVSGFDGLSPFGEGRRAATYLPISGEGRKEEGRKGKTSFPESKKFLEIRGGKGRRRKTGTPPRRIHSIFDFAFP